MEAVVGNQLKDYDTIKHIFVHFVNVFKSYSRGMFTHICVFVLWTFGDIFGLFARCDFDLPQEVRKIHEKLLKSTVFFEINKMFL